MLDITTEPKVKYHTEMGKNRSSKMRKIAWEGHPAY